MTSFDESAKLFFNTYKRYPIDIDRGDGPYLYSKSGERYLDLFGGLAVNALGYNNGAVNRAIEKQIKRYIHISNLFYQDSQIALAERLLATSRYAKVFFCNSGTEGIEGAMKLARKWGKTRDKNNFVSLSNSFHGRTYGAVTLTERLKYRDGYEPMLPGVAYAQFNDPDDLRRTVNDATVAIVFECIQGEGGIFSLTKEFTNTLVEMREKYDLLLIADEIQTGLGRTGKFFCFDHLGFRPDIAVVAKPLGGGLPLGAILGSERVAETFTIGSHGTTFGGNPVACAAGVAVLEQIVEKGAMANAASVGEYLRSRFEDFHREFPELIREVRGRGMMLGIDLTVDGAPFVEKLLERRILINCTNTTVLRFLPPYILTTQEADTALFALKEVMQEYVAAPAHEHV
jgi:acetylornithine/N-succinyldiaminopimelate aminotransferase